MADRQGAALLGVMAERIFPARAPGTAKVESPVEVEGGVAGSLEVADGDRVAVLVGVRIGPSVRSTDWTSRSG